MINFGQFDSIFNKLDARFNRITKDQARQIYYDELKGVTPEGWVDVIKSACRDLKTFPTPGELLSIWYQYTKDHPELTDPDVIEEDCKYCHGLGVFVYTRPDRGHMYEMVSICPHCRNVANNKLIPKMDAIQIRKRGYKLVNISLSKEVNTIKDMDILIDKCTGEIIDDYSEYKEWLKTQE